MAAPARAARAAAAAAQRLEAVAGQKQLPHVAPVATAAPQVSANTITTALFAVYCVLAGVVVARQPRMLLALLSFAAGQAALKVGLRTAHAWHACGVQPRRSHACAAGSRLISAPA